MHPGERGEVTGRTRPDQQWDATDAQRPRFADERDEFAIDGSSARGGRIDRDEGAAGTRRAHGVTFAVGRFGFVSADRQS
jgi:hypothetical protein